MSMRTVLVVLLGAYLISGCTFAPQAVKIQPDVEIIPNSIGEGRPVQLLVVDERPRSTLGTRGLQGVGADLTIDGNLSLIICDAISKGLSEQGFIPSIKPTENSSVLRVEIRNLDYRLIMGFWVSTLTTECGLKAVCIKNSTRPYERLYRGEFKESVMVVQDAEANNRYINSAVSDAVNSLLTDKWLIDCLAEP